MVTAEVQELLKIVQFQTQLSVANIAAEIGFTRQQLLKTKSPNGLNSVGEALRRRYGKEITEFREHYARPQKKEKEMEPIRIKSGNAESFPPENPGDLRHIQRTVFDAHQTLHGLDITLKNILRSLEELEKINYVLSRKNAQKHEADAKIVKIKAQ